MSYVKRWNVGREVVRLLQVPRSISSATAKTGGSAPVLMIKTRTNWNFFPASSPTVSISKNMKKYHTSIFTNLLSRTIYLYAGTVDYSCMPAPPPAPSIPRNLSFFDRNYLTLLKFDILIWMTYQFYLYLYIIVDFVSSACHWIYCGEGTCTKNRTYSHTCQCNPGHTNLLNISAFPCYSDCKIIKSFFLINWWLK